MNIPEGFARVTPYIFAKDAAQYMDHLIIALGGEDRGRTMRDDVLANGVVGFGNASVMISEAGMEKIMDVADMDYGDRQGGVKDKAGNIGWLSQRLANTPYY